MFLGRAAGISLTLIHWNCLAPKDSFCGQKQKKLFAPIRCNYSALNIRHRFAAIYYLKSSKNRHARAEKFLVPDEVPVGYVELKFRAPILIRFTDGKLILVSFWEHLARYQCEWVFVSALESQKMTHNWDPLSYLVALHCTSSSSLPIDCH